ncbi:MAG: helix-turn-helix transcriptional regulator [Lachnospiraceae bacterium]|nr:helix-turn-helix transcriptional regulator [Lachnospiraceae bacterium]MCM1241003.1 helix-turn-helix transcriptional regulator [Lachnospiraceae bacterium]
MNKETNTLSIRIKELRKSKGLTQKQLATAINVSYSAIVGYENGRREPNSKAMAALERYFHVTGEYLRGETNTIEPTYIWEDTEIMDSVKETFPSLIQKLLNSFKHGSSVEQKMLFDILVELCHISGIQKDDPAFRAAAFQLMQENFVHTTRFIDFCKQLPTSSDIEIKRLESFKLSCSEDFDKALSEFQRSLLE